jgi:DNA mismatch repair protein MutS2
MHILSHSTPRSLVLIDELGAGTDPDEGAAIGRAVLDELRELGAKAVVTTHLSSLKAVAFSTQRVDNAAVEFDVETLKPTYRLRLGEPGNSNALIIAKRLGMPARIVKRARQFFDQRTQELNKAIAGTVQLRREAEDARRNAYEAAQQAEAQRARFEAERVELERSQQQFQRWAEWINHVQPGDDVFVKPLNRVAKVVRLQMHRQLALVSSRGMDVEVTLRDLDVPPPAE